MRARAKCFVIGAVCILGAMAWSKPAEAGIQVSYYTPQFYLDYLVFFDQGGKPVYYENDTAYFVPGNYAGYDALVNHFQDNVDAYTRWFHETGYANLNFRLALAYDGYVPRYYFGFPVFYDASGRPIYYSAGTRYLVPSDFAGYRGLVGHYQKHKASYLGWYNARGRKFRWYRQPVHTSYYQPLYFDGYIVYYDDESLPYYYLGGRKTRIRPTDSLYDTYVSHYQANHASYTRWFRSGGRDYRTYRQPVLHRSRVAVAAPLAARGRAVSRRFTPNVGASVVGARRTERSAPREARPRPVARAERHPGARPQQREEPTARPARDYVDCNKDPGHASCRGRGTHQPQGARRVRVENRRGNPGRRR